MRRKFGIEEGSLVITEERDDGTLIRPAVAVPVEVYTPARVAEFLLSNAVNASPAGVLPPDDHLIFLAAMTARATHLLTGDRTHVGPYHGRMIAGVRILPPSNYLRG